MVSGQLIPGRKNKQFFSLQRQLVLISAFASLPQRVNCDTLGPAQILSRK